RLDLTLVIERPGEAACRIDEPGLAKVKLLHRDFRLQWCHRHVALGERTGVTVELQAAAARSLGRDSEGELALVAEGRGIDVDVLVCRPLRALADRDLAVADLQGGNAQRRSALRLSTLCR